MGIYLPIAEMGINGLVLVAFGFASGFLSGMFGVGGAFLLTPLLVFIGVPPAIAVGTQSCQLTGTSISGAMVHWQKRQIDVRMGLVILLGSFIGTFGGVDLFKVLKESGHIDLTIALGYFLLLSAIGGLMLQESWRSLRHVAVRIETRKARAPWGAHWPCKLNFPASDLRISIFAPMLIGLFCGVLVGIFGIGGGFILVPAMLYLLRMPPAFINGTALFQIIFTAALATLLQALMTHSVDVVLAFFLLMGSVTGAQFGARYTQRFRPEMARFLLALLILAVAAKLAFDLVAPPHSVFSHEMRFP